MNIWPAAVGKNTLQAELQEGLSVRFLNNMSTLWTTQTLCLAETWTRPRGIQSTGQITSISARGYIQALNDTP